MALEIRLSRPSHDVPWGFRLIGGKDFNMPLTVVKVQPSSPADMANLCNGDTLISIQGSPADQLAHDDAYEVIREGDNALVLEVLRGRYDLVLDEQEPIYEPYDPQDDFVQPSDATEVFAPLPSLSDIFRPIDAPGTEPGTARERTESPFLLPTKPYRPFSTEPIEVPPLEAPIILNPAYHDEFKLDDFVDEDLLPKTKFKLPISPFYKPEGKDKVREEKRSQSRCSNVEESTFTSRIEDRSLNVSSAFDEFRNVQSTEAKERVESVKETHSARLEVDSSYQSKKTEVKSSFEDIKHDTISKEVIKNTEQVKVEIDLEKIEQAASSVVEESIERAVSVAREIKQEYDIELKSLTESDSKNIKKDLSKEVEAKSLSVEETKLSTVKELEQIKTGTVKTTAEAFEHASEASYKDVVERTNEDIVEGSVKKTSEVFEKSSAVLSEAVVEKTIETNKAKVAKSEVKAQERAKDESVSCERSTRKVTEHVYKTQEQTSKSSASDRAYTIGLQTIPNIRGHIHSSYHYDLLLRTFFIHLTDVMVALSRIILTQPVFDKEKTHNSAAKDTTYEQRVEKEEFTTQVAGEKVVTNEEESVNVTQKYDLKEKKLIEVKKADDRSYIEEEHKRHEHKSGSKMAQLTEHKTEELTEKMDAVITEFQTKAGIEEAEVTVETKPIASSTVESTQVSEVVSSEYNQIAETVMSYQNEQKTTELRTDSRERRSKSREGKQIYVATVESHVYTNKDEILDEQFSESSSVQSVDATISSEQIVDTKIQQIKDEKDKIQILQKHDTKVEQIEENKIEQMKESKIETQIIEKQENKVEDINVQQIEKSKIETEIQIEQETKLEEIEGAKMKLQHILHDLVEQEQKVELIEDLKVEQQNEQVKIIEQQNIEITNFESDTQISEITEKNEIEEVKADVKIESESSKTDDVLQTIEPVAEIEVIKEELVLKGVTENVEMKSAEMIADTKFDSHFLAFETAMINSETTSKTAVFEEISLAKTENFESEICSQSTVSEKSSISKSENFELSETSTKTLFEEKCQAKTEHFEVTSQAKTEQFEQINETKIEQESSFVAISSGDRTKLRRLSLNTEPEPNLFQSNSNDSISSHPSTIDTPTPCTIPPTHLTDEYMFRLSCEVKNLAEPEPKEPSPPKLPSLHDEDPHIVKKKMIPHIDTTIGDRVVYDKPKSPEYVKLGLRGGADTMSTEEILEIGRKSSLLASAIDQTIKSIEEYKEQAGIPLDIKRSSITDQHPEDNLKIYNGFVAEPKTTLFTQNISANEEKYKMEQDYANVVTQMKVTNDNNISSEESNETCNINEQIVSKTFESTKTTSIESNETKIEEETRSVDTRQTEEVKSLKETDTEKTLELQKVVASLITQTDVPKREPLEGYRPVPFDPEEIRNQVTESRMVYACNDEESTQILTNTQKSMEIELIGGNMGIVNGLEEPVMDPDVAKELGKPGIPEDKIAEIISGESEMLREAHVMGLKRVIGSHMCRTDENSSSVDFKKIKPTIDKLKDSEVIKALNEELTKTKTEKKKDERKWTTFLQRPSRPVPSAKFGYPGYMMEPQEVYKPKIVKQPKPKVAPDYKPEDFDTGLLPWEERATKEPPPTPIEPEDPILIPEGEVVFLEALDNLPESEVPDLEETGITLPEPEPEKEPEPEEQKKEEEEEEVELDLEQVIEETEQLVLEDMEKNQIADQLVLNVQSMVDPNATLEQQLAQMRAQLAALAQLPGVIQQTLELVTKQLSQITQQEVTQTETRETVELTETVEEKITKTTEQITEESSEHTTVKESTHEETTEVREVGEEKSEETTKKSVSEEIEALKREEAVMVAEQAVIERQKKEMMDQMQTELASRQVKQHPTPRVGKPKPMFGPLTPQERPLVLPGGRKWRKPKDAFNEQFFTETLQAQAEIIQGKAKGLSFESHILPYDERINFMKFEKPPVSLDHLKESDVYKLVHNMDDAPGKRVAMLTPVIAECDYREKCRSMTPCTELMAQVQP